MSDAGLTCPSCGHENADDSKFCNECGARVGAAPCGSCGETLEAGSKFCRHCGAQAGAGAASEASAATAAGPPTTPVVRSYTPPPASVGDDLVDDPVPQAPEPRVRRAAAAPPPESKTAIWLGVAVAVLGFAWLTMNQQGTPPPPPPTPSAADPHAGHNHPPGEDPAGGDAAGAGYAGGGTTGGPAISGTISVDDALKGQEPTGGHFFVIARKAGSAAPMPVAVVRMPAAAGRVPYILGPENVMGGGPFVGPFDISVRWDQDGVAGKQAGDLSGVCIKNPVNPGDTGADVVLTKKI